MLDLETLDDPSLWRPSRKRAPALPPTPPGGSVHPRPDSASSHTRRSLLLWTSSSCSPPPSAPHPTPATAPHARKGQKFRVPRKVPGYLKDEALRMLQDGRAGRMPRGVRAPELEWALQVVDLCGKKREVRTAGWEGITALRERIAKSQSIYPARKLLLYTLPSLQLVQDGWTASEAQLTPAMTLFCSLPSLPSLPIPLPSIFLSSVLPSPPPAIPPLAPAKNYPSWIAALPSHMADDLLTLYASLLTFHFPPYQGFRIHAHNPPGLPHGFAVHHPLCAGPLLILSYMPVEEFDLARCREAHISGLLATAADMVSPCLYLLSVFGTRWRAIRVSEVEESVECSPVIHPDALPPTTFPGDCSAHTWAPSLLSTESFRTFSEIAHDMKAFFLPHWIAPEEGEIVVRLPTYRIGELTPTSAAAGDRNAIHWLAAPEMIEILPSADQNPLPLPNNARRARVRLPRSTN